MDYKRIALYVATAFIGVMLWSAWQKDYPARKVTHTVTSSSHSTPVTPGQSGSATASGGTFAPTTFNPGQRAPVVATQPQAAAHAASPTVGDVIQVKTNVLDVSLSAQGGNLVSAKLLKYSASSTDTHNPIQILNPDQSQLYIAQNGITAAGKSPLHFTATQTLYSLQPGQDTLTVLLTAKTGNLQVTKRYVFHRGKYAVDVTQQVRNLGKSAWTGSFYGQILRKKPDVKHSMFIRGGYNGGAVSSQQTPYEKLSYSTMNESNLSRSIQGGWLAMQQHYFLSAWIPAQNLLNHYYSHVNSSDSGDVYALGYVTPQVSVAPGKSISNRSILFVGPEIGKILAKLAHGLDLTVDYGWLSPISKIIFLVMNFIHNIVGNWGWSIILVTVLIKLLLYYPSSISYRSMAKMRVLAPRMKALQERHAGDKPALSKATMEMYKKEKVNPMGGCLPMLVQVPIFISLYYVLIESVQLRQSPFIFWIHDLAVMDPYYVLPILMGASMFLQQRLSPQAPDPTQAKMMMFLPLIFTVFFLHFPAGLVLYWLTNNLVSIAQQYYIMQTFDPKKAAKKAANKSRKKRR